ncbi:MAG: hypothetical protein ACTH6O_09090 [Vibrio toranzoniae]
MKVLAFGTSNSKHSINRTLAYYAAQKISDADVTLLKQQGLVMLPLWLLALQAN